MAKKIIHIYWGFTFLFTLSLSFFFATYQLFMASHGLTLMEMSLVAFSYVAVSFLLEIPTGSFADIFGRGKSVVLGCFITALSFLIYFFAHSFWFFILAEVVGAFGITFISGALEAWMVDSVQHHGYTGDLEKIFANDGFFSLAGKMTGSLSGAFLGEIDLSLPWIGSAVGLFILGIYCLYNLKDCHFVPRPLALRWNFKPIRENAKDSWRYGVKHRSVFYIIIFGAILLASLETVNKQWTLLFSDYGLSVKDMGFIFNGIALAIFLGERLSPYLKKLIKKEKDRLILSQAVTGLGIIIAAQTIGLFPALTAFFVHEIGRGLFRPLKSAYLNKRLESQTRATVLSFDSMIGKLGGGVGLIASGVLSQTFSIPCAWTIAGAVILTAIPIFLKLKNGD
ncbi:MAG TPA: MFS transporter [bacterium]|nr:MFS transporter [bacterium]HPT29675.1 MFS transporter [bacterium]